MSHCISEVSSHASTLLIKIWLVTSHAARVPAAIGMLAACGFCCVDQDVGQLWKSCSRVPSADYTPTLMKIRARITQLGNIIILSRSIAMQLGKRVANMDTSCARRCRKAEAKDQRLVIRLPGFRTEYSGADAKGWLAWQAYPVPLAKHATCHKRGRSAAKAHFRDYISECLSHCCLAEPAKADLSAPTLGREPCFAWGDRSSGSDMSASVCSGIVTFCLPWIWSDSNPVPWVRSQALKPFVTKGGEVPPRPILETIFPSVCDKTPCEIASASLAWKWALKAQSIQPSWPGLSILPSFLPGKIFYVSLVLTCTPAVGCECLCPAARTQRSLV